MIVIAHADKAAVPMGVHVRGPVARVEPGALDKTVDLVFRGIHVPVLHGQVVQCNRSEHGACQGIDCALQDQRGGVRIDAFGAAGAAHVLIDHRAGRRHS